MKILLIGLGLIAIAHGDDGSNEVEMTYMSPFERSIFSLTNSVFRSLREKADDYNEFEKFHTCLDRQSFRPNNFAWVAVESFEENVKSACSSKAEIRSCFDELAAAHHKYLKPNKTALLETYLSIMNSLADYACEDNGAKIITARKDENVNCIETTGSTIAKCLRPVENKFDGMSVVDMFGLILEHHCSNMNADFILAKNCIVPNLATCSEELSVIFLDVMKIHLTPFSCDI